MATSLILPADPEAVAAAMSTRGPLLPAALAPPLLLLRLVSAAPSLFW